ncbi:hypothetical protein KAZ57_02600 [Patescibacteria group bacterium]|nr:hypothetical protein [Patescibacteria group bacterium]
MPNLEAIFMNVCVPILGTLMFSAFIVGFHVFMHLQAQLMVQETQAELVKEGMISENEVMPLVLDLGSSVDQF